MSVDSDKTLGFGGFNRIVHGRDAVYVVNENDAYVGRSLIEYGEYCEQEFDLLKQMCGLGSFVAEVGANIGAHTVRMAKQVGLSGRIVAFEPQPVVFQALCATVALNSLMNVDCYPFALAEVEETVRFPAIDYRVANNFGGIGFESLPEGAIPIPIRRFDDCYLHGRLDLLKIDVEGMELRVLKGAQQTIERFRPYIYLENDNRDKSPALISWLFEAGYRLWWHTPALYSPGNFFANPENIFAGVHSVNMLCVHSSVTTTVPLKEVTSADEFPTIVVEPARS